MEGALGVCKEKYEEETKLQYFLQTFESLESATVNMKKEILQCSLPTFEREAGRVGRGGALSDFAKSVGLKRDELNTPVCH